MRTQSPLGIIMLDVNHFKQINDRLGHATGDMLLREMGRLLAAQIRKADVACRYGGNEFVLFLPDASQDSTRERAEKLRREVEDHFAIQKDRLPVPISISLGVAVFPDDGSTGEQVLKLADSALLQSKHGRGNHTLAAVQGGMDINKTSHN